MTAATIAQRNGHTPRLVRDRLRALDRAGTVEVAEGTGSNATWRLTPAGRELHRLFGMMSRIIAASAVFDPALTPTMRDGVIEMVLKSMADPIVLDIGRALAVAPRDATDLERACLPTARRTLYRRLELLVAAGAIERETLHEVPRRTIYRLVDRWRCIATILLLAAWWEWRHGTPADPQLASDLLGLGQVVMPLVRVPPTPDGARLRWRVTVPAPGASMTLEIREGRLHLEPEDDVADTPVDVEASGSAHAWSTALVTGDGAGLCLSGDAPLAREVGAAVRAALLAPLTAPRPAGGGRRAPAASR